jgi:hypothetical protein
LCRWFDSSSGHFWHKIGQKKGQSLGLFMESSRGFSRDRRPGSKREALREGFQLFFGTKLARKKAKVLAFLWNRVEALAETAAPVASAKRCARGSSSG